MIGWVYIIEPKLHKWFDDRCSALIRNATVILVPFQRYGVRLASVSLMAYLRESNIIKHSASNAVAQASPQIDILWPLGRSNGSHGHQSGTPDDPVDTL